MKKKITKKTIPCNLHEKYAMDFLEAILKKEGELDVQVLFDELGALCSSYFGFIAFTLEQKEESNFDRSDFFELYSEAIAFIILNMTTHLVEDNVA
jgi:hypothetical protein